MTKTFIITGAPGVGKSTVCDKLAKSFPLGLHLECDWIYNMVKGGYTPPWDDNDRFLTKTMFKAAQATLKTYAQAGFETVVNYVFEEQELIDFVRGVSAPITLAILHSNLATNICRDLPRQYSIGEERVKYYNAIFENYASQWPVFAINTSHLTVEESVERIKQMPTYKVHELLKALGQY